MESLRKSLKPFCSASNQRQNIREEEQALLHHHMAQSSDQRDQTEEVAIKIDSESPSGKLPGSSKKSKVSFEEVLTEALRQKSKTLPVQGSPSFDKDTLVGNSNSNSPVRQNSWRLLMNKTKSRLLDPPDEQQHSVSVGVLGEEENAHKEDDVDDIPEEYRSIRFSPLTMLQLVSLLLLTATIVCTLSIPFLKTQKLWDLPIWKWETMALALVSGRLLSGWGIRLAVILIESHFLLRKRVLYFVYGLRKAVQNFLWLGLVLLVWHFIFDKKVQDQRKSNLLPYVNKVLFCLLVGTLIWLLKTLLVKVLASSFHVNTFFDRIQEALFSQYVIETLSGPPLFQEQEKNAGVKLQRSPTVGRSPTFSRRMMMEKKNNEEIRIDHLRKLNQKNISAWNMRKMVNIISHGHLSTLDEQILRSDIEDESLLQIKNEFRAKKAANNIFNNVAKPGSQCMYLGDLMCFMGKDEAEKAMHLLGVAASQNEGISKSSLRYWVVNAFRERKALALSLNDTKTAVDELHNMLNFVVAIIIVIIWLIILGIPISHFLVFISSQLLLAVFVFGNTCKTIFQAIIFLVIMHPFDVGDRCEVDGVQMIVEEMNILTTLFLRYDNQKITYPNSVLSSNPIGNFYRSPDMAESIDFSIHISTPMEKITIMKEKLIGYVKSKNEHWHPSPMLTVRDVEDMNRVKFSMCIMHRLNYQNMGERWARRTLLIEEMIRVFKELDIEHRVLPLDVNVRNLPALFSTRLPSNWTTCPT